MIVLQAISKILASGNNNLVENNMLTQEYFTGYEQEFLYIQEHYKTYGNIPDKATFLAKFPEIELVEVAESDEYIVDTLREEHLYTELVPIIQKSAALLKDDSNKAVEFALNSIKNLQTSYRLGGIDIVADAMQRYDQFMLRKEHQEERFFTTGFPELDDLIHGIQRGEEFFVIFARTNQGKSWVLEKICTHIWQIGYNVGYVSPEMRADSIGYRFDTLYKNYSNSGLTWGKDDINEEEYLEYIKELKTNNNKFIVSTPLDFNKSITITKLRNWVKQFKLDMIAIDGITYITDERYKRGDNKTTSLTNISEDLMALSMELKVPILVVVQANRSGVIEKGTDNTPELESIRDSDGIRHNASKVLSINQREYGVLDMIVKKQRFGPVGGKLTYNWNINLGEFTYIPTEEDANTSPKKEEKIQRVRKSYNDSTDVF